MATLNHARNDFQIPGLDPDFTEQFHKRWQGYHQQMMRCYQPKSKRTTHTAAEQVTGFFAGLTLGPVSALGAVTLGWLLFPSGPSMFDGIENQSFGFKLGFGLSFVGSLIIGAVAVANPAIAPGALGAGIIATIAAIPACTSYALTGNKDENQATVPTPSMR